MQLEKNKANRLCGEFLGKQLLISCEDFIEEFRRQRDSVYQNASEALFQLNKKGFLNGFNLKYLSLPLEHSMQQNYWCYQSLKVYLKDQVRN